MCSKYSNKASRRLNFKTRGFTWPNLIFLIFVYFIVLSFHHSKSKAEMVSEKPPAKQRRRLERNPDLPETLSSIPAVQSLIRENNSQTKPKNRLKKECFFYETFTTLGLRAVEETSSRPLVKAFAVELAQNHRLLPIDTAVAKVLHSWGEAELILEGIDLISTLLQLQESVEKTSFERCFAERTITVALRLCVKSKEDEAAHLIRQLVNILPDDKFKRRIFSPLLEKAMVDEDPVYALETFELAVKRGIELWDKEYHAVLTTVEKCMNSGRISNEFALRLTERILDVMEKHHPVVGCLNGNILARILKGKEATISTSGECSTCQCTLSSFELSDTQRDELMLDLLEKLIKPKIEGKSEKEKPSATELETRNNIFETFKNHLNELDYDTLIDGANVGYYGLNSWYKQAKDALLQSRGINPSSVPLQEREEVPFPVDVSPKFSIIESMRKQAVNQHRKPLIVLHQRHLDNAIAGEQKEILDKWSNLRCVISSPVFLNDDYCWLYAALRKKNAFIISNDQMRDHRFTMLSPRCFIRWRQRHRLTFTALYHRPTACVSLNLKSPRPYSTWVQKAFCTVLNTGISPSKHHWHIPFMRQINIIDQASNTTTSSPSSVELAKNGDDECSSWICTFSGENK